MEKLLRGAFAGVVLAAQVAQWGDDVVCGQSGGVGLVRGCRFLLASNDNGERAHKYEGASGYNFEGRLFAKDNERQNDSKNDAQLINRRDF